MNKKIMIFAPHPDDEILMTAGIIERSLEKGNKVKVVIITNGDYEAGNNAYGQRRLRESISALTYLGLSLEDIIFLGYGDTGMPVELSFLMRLYYATGESKIVKSHVGSITYGLSDIKDFHSSFFGIPGEYNRKTLLYDLETVLKSYNPDDIYVPSLYDSHGDHRAANLFIVRAIINIKRLDESFSPVLHESIIHPVNGDENSWPSKEDIMAPVVPFSMPPQLEELTPLRWKFIESIQVPDNMLITPRSKNKKYQAIMKYTSQSYCVFPYSFVKQNEFFWKKDFANFAINASVDVSSENHIENQLGFAAIDGIADGFPRFPHNEWVTRGELDGAWIKLSWKKAISVKKVTLYDRPNLDDNIERAELSFSDGSSIYIGPLKNDGSGDSVVFPTKNITWIKLTIIKASGKNTGLSEFEVF